MARLPRLTLDATLHHVLQRGAHGQPVFVDAADHAQFLALLALGARTHRVAVHAYVLLPDRWHLLLTPTDATSLPRLLQGLQRQYAHYFNTRHGRQGTLWMGRFRSAPIESKAWLWPSLVFMDTQPVVLGLAADAADYVYSSHRHYAGLDPVSWLQLPAAWWPLGDTPFAREAAYRRIVAEGLSDDVRGRIADAARLGWPLGSTEFLERIQAQTPRPVRPRRPGRPRRSPEAA